MRTLLTRLSLVVTLLAAAGGVTQLVVTAPVAAAPSCSSSGTTCVPIPCSGASCPTVVVNPATDVDISSAGDPWVYVDLEHFNPGDVVDVAYCSDVGATALADQPCELASETQLYVGADGTAATSVQVSTLDPPVVGDNGTTFGCDGAPCSVDVTDPYLNGTSTKSSANTAVVPITFAGPATACPGADQLTTESDFGLIQPLLPAADQAACTGSSPATAFNTEFNPVAAAQAVVGGTDQVAFVDNPDDPAVQSVLGGSSGPYAFIPVAVTADVVGFNATDQYDNSNYPDNTFDLTPTMVAGLVGDVGSYGQSDPPPDPVACPGHASQPPSCSLLTELNPPTPGFSFPSSYGATVAAGVSGETYNLTSWLCAAPAHVPVPVGSSSAVEASTPAATLVSGDPGAWTSGAACPVTDQFPALQGGSWQSEQSPAQQDVKLVATVAQQPSPSADFAPMTWSEAYYFGLDTAGLQNASGAFVQPSATSIDDALAAATTLPNGTLSPSYTATASGAYPMPDVVYAVVSTDEVSAAQAGAETSLLDGLLDVSSPSATTALPGGFVPLTPALYAEAEAAVKADIHAEPPATTTPPTTTTTTPSTPAPTASSPTAAAPAAAPPAAAPPVVAVGLSSATFASSGLFGLGSLGFGEFGSLGSSLPTAGGASAPTPGPMAVTASGGSGAIHHVVVVPTPVSFELAAADTQTLVPWFVIGWILAILLGPVLLIGLRLSNRRRALAASAVAVPVEPASPPGPPGPPET